MVYVRKASGEREAFDEKKVTHSIQRAGIPQSLQTMVLSHVKSKLYTDIPTSEIYQHITEFLKSSQQPYTTAKYSLKQAIMALGPTGHPFEDYIAAILQTQGYITQTRVIVQGKCITHEIDVIAERGNEKLMIETKFHNMPGTKTDSHVALYTKARFDDIMTRNGFTKAWLVTNTKATIDAFTYGMCSTMHVVGWSLPEGESLRDIVEKTKLLPVTALTSLSMEQQQKLLLNHTLLCQDIAKNPDVLYLLNLTPEKKKKVLEEVTYLIKP